MRINKSLRADQEIIKRYLDVLGGGSVVLGSSKLAQPDFFISAHNFIADYIEGGLFKKEEVLIKFLENGGFPTDEGPVGAMRSDQQKSREHAKVMITAAKLWHAGDEIARSELGWAVSEYNNTLRSHMDRLRNLIVPLLEQTFSIDDEQRIADEMNVAFKSISKDDLEKYVKQIEELEEELSDWR
jgi:hemerythrin-like domain-containing protein